MKVLHPQFKNLISYFYMCFVYVLQVLNKWTKEVLNVQPDPAVYEAYDALHINITKTGTSSYNVHLKEEKSLYATIDLIQTDKNTSIKTINLFHFDVFVNSVKKLFRIIFA